jgi:YVTN family beta-propeller protein
MEYVNLPTNLLGGEVAMRRVLLWAIAVLWVTTAAWSRGKSGNGNFVLVTNWGDDTVSLVNIVEGTVASTIKVGNKPYDVKVEPSGRFAYVSISGGSYLSVIDL